MKRFVKLGLILIFVILLCTGLIFLPEYVVKRGDTQYMNQFKLYARDTSADNLTTLSLDEKLKILSYEEGSKNVNQVLAIYTYQDLQKSEKNLLSKLQENIKKLENMKIMPVLSDEISWQSSFSYAELDNLSLLEKPGSVLSVWRIEFNDYDDGVSCTFVFDSDTYQIYEVYVNGWQVDEYLDQIYEQMYGETDDTFLWGDYWLKSYGSYLAADAEVVSDIYFESDVINVLGYLEVGEIRYFIDTGIEESKAYAGIETDVAQGQYNTFYFRPDTELNNKMEVNEQR